MSRILERMCTSGKGMNRGKGDILGFRCCGTVIASTLEPCHDFFRAWWPSLRSSIVVLCFEIVRLQGLGRRAALSPFDGLNESLELCFLLFLLCNRVAVSHVERGSLVGADIKEGPRVMSETQT